MAGIFISYRRDDTGGYAGWLLDALKKSSGENLVFLDSKGIDPGLSFRQVLQEQLASCEVMLVLIGKRWLDLRDKSGIRRLDSNEDIVRLEIGTALKRSIPVVPVLVQGAPLPKASKLPEDLKALAERQAYELRDDRWDSDVQLLVARVSTRVPSIAEVGRADSHPTQSSSFKEPLKMDLLFTQHSLLTLFSSTIAIGVVYQLLYLRLHHDEVLYFAWLAIGFPMGLWHAARARVNIVRDLILGFVIAVAGALVMSAVGWLFYHQPFWPRNSADWQIGAMHMTAIMGSFVAGALWPSLAEKRWFLRKIWR